MYEPRPPTPPQVQVNAGKGIYNNKLNKPCWESRLFQEESSDKQQSKYLAAHQPDGSAAKATKTKKVESIIEQGGKTGSNLEHFRVCFHDNSWAPHKEERSGNNVGKPPVAALTWLTVQTQLRGKSLVLRAFAPFSQPRRTSSLGGSCQFCSSLGSSDGRSRERFDTVLI